MLATTFAEAWLANKSGVLSFQVARKVLPTRLLLGCATLNCELVTRTSYRSNFGRFVANDTPLRGSFFPEFLVQMGMQLVTY